ncbi:MAG: S41 family peptidase [Proteobacteria bacterium]|jgi:carboxyl-terminal processing protease|nr:S41 family peptidase [Pseudomonadota bacterium]
MSQVRLAVVLTVVACVVVAPFSCAYAKTDVQDNVEKRAENTENDTYKYLTLFADVLERTRADYVDDVTDEKLVENAINGMLVALDPHSGYMNKKNYEDMQTQTKGRFGGLGIEVTMEDNLIKVISPIDDTPAARAGIQPNDLITHLDSKPVTELTLGEAVDKMRGTPGTKIILTVRRGGITGQPFDVTLTRDIIQVHAVRWEQKDDVAYIRIKTFNEQTQPDLDKALSEIGKKMGNNLSGYVLDLRNNPGGLLDQAVSVSSSFIDAGKEVVSTRSRHKEDNQSYLSRGGDKTKGLPIVTLINGGSASASEIVAGALQDYHRAILLGTKSFGKGSVQTIIPLGNTGAMRLTTARYYTPSGRSIQQSGIEPDIIVQPAKVEKIDSDKGIREADLRGALANDTVKKKDKRAKDKISSSDEGTDSTKKDGEEKPVDYQLERALDIIRGIHLYAKHEPLTKIGEQSE